MGGGFGSDGGVYGKGLGPERRILAMNGLAACSGCNSGAGLVSGWVAVDDKLVLDDPPAIVIRVVSCLKRSSGGAIIREGTNVILFFLFLPLSELTGDPEDALFLPKSKERALYLKKSSDPRRLPLPSKRR